MTSKGTLLLIVFLAFLSGCDTFSQIRREDPQLPSSPSFGCIERALRGSEKVLFKDYHLSKTFNNLIGNLKDANITHVFSYHILAGSEKYLAQIHVKTTPDGKTSYNNVYSRPGSTLSELEKKIITPALKHVDNSVSTACGIKISSKIIL